MNCLATADALSLALRVNGEPSGFTYGTGVFSRVVPELITDNELYMDALCDCARTTLRTSEGRLNCNSG